jgi:hypothetical protein
MSEDNVIVSASRKTRIVFLAYVMSSRLDKSSMSSAANTANLSLKGVS